MTTLCDDCVFAEWKKTANGRLHPNKRGLCKRLYEHPLDLRIPPVFYWGVFKTAPYPSGGYIERGKPLEEKCIFKTGINPRDIR
jgi:hypothetical protein